MPLMRVGSRSVYKADAEAEAGSRPRQNRRPAEPCGAAAILPVALPAGRRAFVVPALKPRGTNRNGHGLYLSLLRTLTHTGANRLRHSGELAR